MDPLTPNLPELSQTQGGARGSASPPDAHARWRLELERAQLKLQSNARPAPSAPAQSAEAGDPAHQPGAAGRQAAAGQAAPGTQRDSAASPSKESFSRSAQQAGATAGQAPRASGASGGSAFAGAPAQPREMASPPPAPAQAPGGRAPQRTAWPNTNLFVVIGEDQVKAWVRDASLGEAERKRLLHDLRAKLRAAGFKLDALTVNGREEST